MDELQTWWEVPCIGQFVSLFRFAFSLPELDIEDLEKAFIADGTEEGSPFMQNLLISLIRGFYRRNSISLENWESYFRRIVNRFWFKRDRRRNPLSDTTGFSQLNLRTKVELVYHLCLYRLECNDVIRAMKSMDADALRVQSLGSDSQGNVYWYFYGTRLYKEAPSPAKSTNDRKKNLISSQVPLKRGRGRPRKNTPVKSDGESDELEDSDGSKKYLTLDSKSRWSVVCTTLAEWKAFAAKFKSSKVKCETDLFQLIKNNFLPVLTEMYEKKKEKEKAQAKEALASNLSLSRTGRKKKNVDEISSGEKQVNTSKQRKRRQTQSTSLDRKIRRIEGQNFAERVETSKTVATAVTTVTTTTSTCVPSDNYVIDKNLSYEPDLVLKLRKVLSSVKLHKDAWPFLYSVDELVAPGYYDIVKEPVDLSSIERKIELKAYSNLTQIEADFQRLVSNCSLYNGENSTYTSMAKSLWRVFRKGISEFLRMPDPSSESDSAKDKESVKDASSDAKSTSTSVSKPQQRPKCILKGKKRTRSQTMAGLDMLAEASELALKDVGKTEGELFVVDTPGIPLKSKAFPDLKIVTIQNHPPSFIAKCKRSSTSSRESVESDTSLRDSVSPASTSSQCSNDSDQSKSSKSEGRRRKKVRLSLTTRSSNVTAEESCVSDKPVSPDSCNVIGIEASTRSNDRLSNSESSQGSPKSLQDFAETIHFLDEPGDVSKSDTLTNLSSLLCRILKENPVSNSQNLLYVGTSDSNLSEDNFEPPKLERVSENNVSDKCFSESRSGSSPSTSVQEDQSLLPPKLNTRSDFIGLKSLDNITTVDASAIGISTITSSGSDDIDTVQQEPVYLSEESVSNAQKASVEDENVPENVAFTTELSPVLYSSHNDSKANAQNPPEMPLSSTEKTDIDTVNCGVNVPDSNLLQQNLAFHVPYPNGTLNPSPNSEEAVSYSGQNAFRISPPMAAGSLNYFPEFLLPRLPMPMPNQSSSQLSVSTSSSFIGNQESKLSVTLPSMTVPGPLVSFMPANGPLSSPSSSLSYGAPTSASSYIPESQLYTKLSASSLPVNGNNKKIAIKPANSMFKNGTKKDSSPRHIKKKRSVIVSQNQQNNLVIESNITKTVHATVAETSEIESLPEQYIPAESSALYKLTNLVSHTRSNDIEKEARYLSVSPTSRMENNSKISSSSMFVPYTTSIDTTKCGMPQVPSFWNGKEKSFCNMPSTHAMTFPLFPPHPPISTCAPMSTFCNNNSYYVNNSLNKSQTLVHCVPSSQPAFFDPSLSSADSLKTNLSIPVSCSGNVLHSAQPVNSNSPQQVPDSRTISPESQKDFGGLLPQKFNDGVFHTYGIQSGQPISNVPTQQLVPQSFVTLPPSSYILPVQPPMSSMMPHSLLQNFVMNSKSVDASLSTFNEIRPQFTTNRTMPVYTILQNMPAKIVQ